MIAISRRVFIIFLESSLFAAIAALSMSISTERLVLPEWSFQIHALHFLLFGGVLLAYNLHFAWYRSIKAYRSTAANVPYNFRVVLLLLGGVSCLMSLAYMPVSTFMWVGIMMICALLYTLPFLPLGKRVKDFGILKVFTLSAVWTIGTAILPIVFYERQWALYMPEILLRFLFMLALCLSFDIRDVAVDKKAGIKTFPVIIGEQPTYRLIIAVLCTFVLMALWQFLRVHSSIRFGGEIIVALLSWLAIRHAGKQKTIIAYLFWVDGMMILYGVVIGI